MSHVQTWGFDLGDVPRPDLVRPRGQELWLFVLRVSQDVATLSHLVLTAEEPIHGRCRAQILTFVQEHGIDLGRSLICELRRVEHFEHAFALCSPKRSRRRRSRSGMTRPRVPHPPIVGGPGHAQGVAGSPRGGELAQSTNGSHGASSSLGGSSSLMPRMSESFFWNSMMI